MKIENHLGDILSSIMEKQFGVTVTEKMVQIQKTKKEFEGDLTIVVFPFVKMLRKSPVQVGDEIGQLMLDASEHIVGFNTVQGFLNLVISDQYWTEELLAMSTAENYGFSKEKKGRMMVEYSSPNTNKPLHLGHLRNNFLGHAVSRILEANGHDVVKTQIVNDRGIHICKSMLAWERFGEGETPESSGMKGDKLVGKYYVIFDQKLREETKEILAHWEKGDFSGNEEVKSEYERLSASRAEKTDKKAIAGIDDKIKKLANNATPLMKDVKEMLQKWEAQESNVYALWEKMNGWVYEGFAETYEAMEVDFDHLYYESKTYLTGKEMVDQGLEKGVFYTKEDGSVWIDLSDEGLDEKLVLRGDGTAVYVTQDIGTAQQRMQDYPDLGGIVYTVGDEQDYHFKVLFLILKKLGYSWAENCHHLSYGMVDLPTGKMKSREGTVVDADELIQEVTDKAEEMTQERGHIEGMDEAQKQELYKMIGLGGLKYYLLRVDPTKRILFKPEESVELNGNTGPFIQYVHARISSLLRKAASEECGTEVSFDKLKENAGSEITLSTYERELVKHLVEYESAISLAAREYAPSVICAFAYDLGKLYNSLWQNVPILIEEDEVIKAFRVVLSELVVRVMKSSAYLLGMNVPERM